MLSDLLHLLKPEVKKVIKQNLSKDPHALLLNPPSGLGNNAKDVINQIIARQKAKGKLPSWWDNFDLLLPPPLSVEQASSEQTAAYKKTIFQGKQLVDLTGGTAIDTLALSDNFSKTTYVEQNELLCEIAKHNAAIQEKDIEVKCITAENFLAEYTDSSTCFFIDPARRNHQQERVFKLADCSPNLEDILPKIRKHQSQILIKLSPLLDIKATLEVLSNVSEVHIVSVKNDCKELLLKIDYSQNTETDQIPIHCINLESNHPDFYFSLQSEASTEAKHGTAQKFLYEPNASVLKAGAFKKIASNYQLRKIAPNTHLYTSDQVVQFPGRIFEIKEAFDKKQLAVFAPDRKINVITRNHPLKPAAIKKKYRLKDGGTNYLIGFTDWSGTSHLYFANRVPDQEKQQ